jgi:hypothetical protein
MSQSQFDCLSLPSKFGYQAGSVAQREAEGQYCSGEQAKKTQRAMVALSGLSDLQSHMLQLKRERIAVRGQCIRRLAALRASGSVASDDG